MVVTMVEARVAEEKVGTLVDAYHDLVGSGLPDFIVETMLLRADGDDMWRIATLWKSRAALDEYVATVEVPGAAAVFGAAGAEPALTIFEVAERAGH